MLMRSPYNLILTLLLCLVALFSCGETRTLTSVADQPITARDSLNIEKQAYNKASKDLKKRQKTLRRDKTATQDQHEQLKTDYIALQQWYLEIVAKEHELKNTK